ARRKRTERGAERIELLDAHRFEIVAEGGLDRAFPARLHFQRRREARPRRESRAAQPFARLTGTIGERGCLQGLERGELRARRLAGAARPLEARLGGELCRAGRLHLPLRFGERMAVCLTLGTRLRLAGLELRELLGELARPEIGTFCRETC